MLKFILFKPGGFLVVVYFCLLASSVNIFTCYTTHIRDYKLEEAGPKIKTVGKVGIQAKLGTQINPLALEKNPEGLPFPYPTQ